jgi:hypothetical protein
LLSSTFTPSHQPICLTGARHDGEIDVQEGSDLASPSLTVFRRYPSILTGEVNRAAALAHLYDQLVVTPPAGGAWRIFRAMSVYIGARTATDILDRLHQYCRCIDGLILSEPGRGSRQFKSRTELFIGPSNHTLIGELYAIRSDVEHLHEHKYLESFSRAERLDLVRKEAIVEHIARNALAHIIRKPALWPYFGNTAALAPFWNLDHAERQRLWGPSAIRTSDALVGYDPEDISDDALGKPGLT